MLLDDILKTKTIYERKIFELELQKIQCDLLIDHYKKQSLGAIIGYCA